jgi:DNA modification methylase
MSKSNSVSREKIASPNLLYFGDNLHWLPKIAAGSIDLIYLDPPFNSKATYNLLYRSPDGEAAPAQYKAFVDSWRWDTPADAALARIMTSGSPAAGIIASLHNHMQKSDLMAYLVMMTARLIELHRVLKVTGSLYLHCDSSASHYLKIILDSVFGPQSFRNEILWKRSSAHNDGKQGARHFGRITDTILFYTKSKQSTWNTLHTQYDESYASGMYKYVEEQTGRRYGLFDLTGPGGAAKGNPEFDVLGVTRFWRFSKERMKEMLAEGRVVQTRQGSVPRQKRYLDEMPGVQLQNLWDDLPVISNRSKEALGYQTQKPLSLLERIISASSDPGDIILDPFCGCGTAIEAAHSLGRKWIGIDITALAVDVVERRLSRQGLRRGTDYKVDGVPLDTDGAKRLFEQDPHQFQLWAITLVDGQPRDGGKRGADKGVDGIVYYQDDARTIEQALISVKGGENIHATHVRDLVGAMNNNQAKLGLFVTLHKPTSAMLEVAREAGSVDAGGKLRPRVQIRTIEQLLDGRKPSMPPVHDIISAAAAARRLRLPTPGPTPEEIRNAPSFKYSIKGSKNTPLQESLPLSESLLIEPRSAKASRNRTRLSR